MVYYRFLLSIVFFSFACDILHDDNCITFGIERFPVGLDPSYKSGIIEAHIYSQIYETLICLDSDYQTLVPNLARSWFVFDDNTRFIFKLRDSVRFHDGSVLRADDVKYSIMRKMQNDETCSLAQIVDSVSVIDSLTVQVKLKYPYYQFLHSLTSPLNLVVTSDKSDRQFGYWLSRNPIGTGPFQIDDWKESKEIVLSTFSGYWQGINKSRQVIFRVYEDDSNREMALEDGEIDILYLVTGYAIDILKWKGTIDYYVQKPMNTIFLGFNNKNIPLNDIRIRKAIQKAVPLKKLVYNVFRGNAIIAKGPLPPSIFKFNVGDQEGYNLEAAKNLLKQAGYEDGLSLKFYFPMIAFSRQTIIEILRNELGKVGISLEVKLFNNWEEHDRAIKSDSSQMFIDSYSSDFLGDAHHYLYSLFHSKSPTNSLHYSRDKVDRWLDAACRESNAQVRQELYVRIVKQILRDIPALFLFHGIPHFAYNRRKIKKMVVDPYQVVQFHRLELYE